MYIYFTGIHALIDQQLSLRIRFVLLLTPLLHRDQVNSLIRYAEVEIRIIVYMVKCPNISVIDWSVIKFDWSPQLSLQSTF